MADQKIIKDQESILSNGMHGGLHPATVPRGQYSRGINLACRGGYVTTRPGWSHVKDLGTTLTPFQGASRWRPGNTEYLVSVFNGSAFFYDIEGGTITTFPGVVTAGPRVCMAQADVLLVMGTGDSVAVFSLDVDGVPTKVYPLADPESGKLQPCSIMHYCQGRLHSVPQKVGVGEAAIAAYDRYFVSGDILQPGIPATIYDASEAALINGGGALGLPDELGPIRGMISAQSPGKGTGVGPLLVFARNGIAAFDVGISPRASVVSAEGVIQERGWYDQQIGSVLNYGTGTDSPWSLVVAGTDVWFRGRDGIYSFKRTVANAQSGLMDVNPESYEVKRWMDPETNAAGVSGATVDRRLFMTAISDGASGFMGVVSLDQAVSTTLGTPTPPAYDGLWTGPRIAKIVEASRQGKPTLFAVTTDAQVYFLDPTADTDSGVEITSQLITRAMFSDPEMRNPYKRLLYADLWLSDITRTTSVDLYFRPDGYPLWTKMGCTKTLTVATDSLPQERRRMRFALRDGAFCENDRRPGMNSGSVRHGFMYQIKVVLTGCAKVTRLETAAAIVDEESPSQETTDTVQSFAIVPNACHFTDDDFTQSSPGVLSFDGGWVRGTRAEAGVGIPDVAWPPQYTRQVLPPGPVGPRGPKGDQGVPGTLLALEDASRYSVRFDPSAQKIQLSGDVLQPGGSSFYGVNPSGTRGWYGLSDLPQRSLQFNETDDKIELKGDVENPGNDKVYGTNSSGVRGWKDGGSGGAVPGVQGSIEVTTGDKLQLSGDADVPGAYKVYGANADGVRGWYTLPEMLGVPGISTDALVIGWRLDRENHRYQLMTIGPRDEFGYPVWTDVTEADGGVLLEGVSAE